MLFRYVINSTENDDKICFCYRIYQSNVWVCVRVSIVVVYPFCTIARNQTWKMLFCMPLKILPRYRFRNVCCTSKLKSHHKKKKKKQPNNRSKITYAKGISPDVSPLLVLDSTKKKKITFTCFDVHRTSLLLLLLKLLLLLLLIC